MTHEILGHGLPAWPCLLNFQNPRFGGTEQASLWTDGDTCRGRAKSGLIPLMGVFLRHVFQLAAIDRLEANNSTMVGTRLPSAPSPENPV